MEISEFLFDVTEELQRRGHVLDDETIKQAALRLSHPSVRSKIESDAWTVEQVVTEIEAGVRGVTENRGASGVLNGTPEFAVEGGFVNDQTGQATDQFRQSLGMR